jgi:alpha-glucosidase
MAQVGLNTDNRPWWRDAVIYQVYVRSFADANGDGEGDLRGVRERLPYLAELGVDAIWLNPFYRSPMADGGYDVADPCDVDPMFGELADADALIAAAHEVGIRVIVDIVPNHSSDQHPWFQAALAGDEAMRERYHFKPGKGENGELPPNNWPATFGGPAWHRTTNADGTPGDWYLHLFAPEQPDLNWEHPAVHAEYLRILRFWLDRGVDGFRIDVAHGMVKVPGLPDVPPEAARDTHGYYQLPYYDQDTVHDIHREWRALVNTYDGDRILCGEAWAPSLERLALYTRPDELHQAFNFHYLMTPWDGLKLRQVIDASLTTAGSATATWVLANHDVTRVASRYGEGEQGLRRARAGALLTLALPGVAYVYQGDELGLPEVTDLPEESLQDPIWENSQHTQRGRDGCRVPIPWSGAEPPFGFSPEGAQASWLPVPERFKRLSVEAQTDDPDSTLTLYRELLRLRRALPQFGDGTLTWLPSEPGTLIFSRGDGKVGVAVNTTDAPVRLPEGLEPLLTSVPDAVTRPDAAEGEDAGLLLAPDSAIWWRGSGVDAR